MIQKKKSATLGCNNDQTLFEPVTTEMQTFSKGTRPHNKEEGVQWKESDTANTLNTFDVGEVRTNELVCFGICSKDSNAMKSDNPKSGFYKADTSRTLDGNGGNPNCNQGGMAVVSIQGSMIGREDKNDPAGSGVGEDVSFTLNTVDRHGVAYGIDRAAFNQGKNAKYDITIEEELNSSLVAKEPSAVAYGIGNGQADQTDLHDKIGALNCMHDQQAVMCDYIVRRLTPTECARLQGFPDWWCDDIAVPEPTEDDMKFWRGVFDTYADINGQKQHKTDNQIRKWLADPHTDSAEYKMWGNGCALPNAYYVIFGIAEVLKEDNAAAM